MVESNDKYLLDSEKPMQRKTRSILEELNTMSIRKDKNHIVESRASNVIASAIRLMEQIDSLYDAEQSENLNRKLLNAIRLRDADKFARSVKRTNDK